MATKKAATAEAVQEASEAAQEVVQEAVTGADESNVAEVKETEKPKESVYAASELANSASLRFNTRPECVAAALKSANVTECTLSQAKEIVDKFIKKEVK